MRVFRAFITLIKHYRLIMPVYLLVTVLTYLVSTVAPLIGTLFLLPLKVSVAYAMLMAILNPSKADKMPLNKGIQSGYYLKNTLYLVLQQFLYLIPLFVGLVISGLIYQYIDVEFQLTVIILNIVLFSIPSVIISLMLAMVPFLLADDNFDQRTHSPIKHSMLILKGNYTKLIAIRLFFIPWLLWITSGFILSIVSLLSMGMGEETMFLGVAVSWLISLPFTYLLINPWYQMTHAELYAEIRSSAL